MLRKTKLIGMLAKARSLLPTKSLQQTAVVTVKETSNNYYEEALKQTKFVHK